MTLRRDASPALPVDARLSRAPRLRLRSLHVSSAVVLFLAGAASLADAGGFCEGERERAQTTMQRIEREWPLRGSGDAISAYMQALVERLARRSNGNGFPWRVNVIRNRAANAFAIGGSHIYVTDGALTFVEDESELAAILAHEMGHQLSGHFCGPAPPGFLDRIFDLFGRAHQQPSAVRQRNVGSLALVVDLAKEQQADEIAVNLLRMCGYDPVAMLALARRLPSGRDSSHLQDSRRIAALEKLLSGVSSRSIGDSTEFQQAKKTLAPE